MEFQAPDYPPAPPSHDPSRTRAPSAPRDFPPDQPPGRRARVVAVVRHAETSVAALAILIGFASVFSAVIAWRASLASIDASRYESLVVQQQARIGQIDRELEALVAQDLRFVNTYQEHALAARELRSQADSLRAGDPAAADILDLEAQAELDLARALQPFFQGAQGITLGENGTVEYDVDYVLTNLRAGAAERRELATARSAQLADRADTKSLSLVGVAVVMVAALFFLTIAQVSRARTRIRQVFFVAGGLLVGFGTLGFVVAEVFG